MMSALKEKLHQVPLDRFQSFLLSILSMGFPFLLCFIVDAFFSIEADIGKSLVTLITSSTFLLAISVLMITEIASLVVSDEFNELSQLSRFFGITLPGCCATVFCSLGVLVYLCENADTLNVSIQYSHAGDAGIAAIALIGMTLTQLSFGAIFTFARKKVSPSV